MTDEGMSTQGLGHQVGWIVSRRDALKVDLLALNCISNEVKLNSEMTGSERSLGGCSNLEACLVVLADEGGSSRSMTKFGHQLAQIKRFSSGEAKRNVLSFSS